MQLKTILNRVAKQPGFVFGPIKLVENGSRLKIEATLRARRSTRARCSSCFQRRPTYDHLFERLFEFVPLWNIAVWFRYTPRRVDCGRCGVVIEAMPWAMGKSAVTVQMAWFLASWAKVLSWTETARRFGTRWDVVFSAVRHAVERGKQHRSLDGIRAIGVDELSWKKGHKYLTVVYQLDEGCRRLLWIGRDRTAATFTTFFDWLGAERAGQLHFVVSDMWKAFLGTVARHAAQAVHVLDRFHIAKLCNEAIDAYDAMKPRGSALPATPSPSSILAGSCSSAARI